MKIQIDCVGKRVQVLDECNLGLLFDELEILLPGWRAFTLSKSIGEAFDSAIEVDKIGKWGPIETVIPEIVPYYPAIGKPFFPIDFSSAEYQGIYNVEIME